MSNKIDIGFLEKKGSWLLHPKFFPSKVGGKPSWLNLGYLPSPKDLLCKLCQDPLVFLCQVYAPYEESDECFHRTIFMFLCRNGACCRSNSSDNIIILRCQLPRKNDYYSSEPYDEDKEEVFPMDRWPKLCIVCGYKAPSHCAKCKKTFYCTRKHQVLDWQKEHKEYCANFQSVNGDNVQDFIVTNAGKSLLFEEWELIIDDEDEEDTSDIDVESEMEKMKKILQEKNSGSLNNVSEDELEQYATNAPKDKMFSKFSKRVSRHPDQVLRYDRGGDPLWITEIGNSLIVPKCPYCNGDRQFEFQLMPQLLNFINVGVEANSIDWGILAVYTCKNSCSEGPAYKEEYVIKQDLTT